MSNLWANCRNCVYEKLTDDMYPCDKCVEGDECLDKRIPELESKVKALETENARFRKALEEIAKVRYGLDLGDTDEYRADYFFRRVDCCQDIARKALRGPSPA